MARTNVVRFPGDKPAPSTEREELSRMIQRSHRLLLRQWPQLDRVDRWDRFRRTYSLLCGIVSLFGIDRNKRFAGVIVCPADEVDAVKAECRHSALARMFLEAGARLLIHGWRRGEDGRLSSLREVELFRRDLCWPYCHCPGAAAEYKPEPNFLSDIGLEGPQNGVRMET